jgi:preprotein translocase subunit SecE
MVQQRGNTRAVTSATATVRRGGVTRFFRDTYAELRRATWPTRQETWRLTIIVMIIAAVLGAALGLIDWVFKELFERFVIGI